MDLEELYKYIIIINKLGASLFGTKIEQSDSGMKNYPYFSVVSEVANYDVDLTADIIRTNEEDNDMNISLKEWQSTVGYQETLRIDVKISTKTIKQYGDQYMKLLMLQFLKKRTCSTRIFRLFM